MKEQAPLGPGAEGADTSFGDRVSQVNESETQSEYIQHHPGAIEDPDKARIMAYASKGQEEAVVASRASALEAARHIGSSDFRDSGNREAKHAATHHAEQAKIARVEADKQATLAAETYDTVSNL